MKHIKAFGCASVIKRFIREPKTSEHFPLFVGDAIYDHYDVGDAK